MNWENAITLSSLDAKHSAALAEESRTRTDECVALAEQASAADEKAYWTARAAINRTEAAHHVLHAASLDALVLQARGALGQPASSRR